MKKDNKKIVLCHGVFDLIHPGHIIHLEEAKKLGDVLVVSITSAPFVRKGPDRPYFSDQLRLKFLSSLFMVDYVILSENYTVDDVIEVVQPDLYVKGKEYSNSADDITGKIDDEAELVRSYGGDIYFTEGEVFSSTKLINNNLPVVSSEVKDALSLFSQKYSFNDIKNYLDGLLDTKILVVGDIIIDNYIFCHIKGLMSKDNGYSSSYVEDECYLGGSLAIARHLANFSNFVTVCGVVGNETNIHSKILDELGSSMRVDLCFSDEYNTIVKKRFVSRNDKRDEINKIFSINNLPDVLQIDDDSKKRFIKKLEETIGNYDLVVLCDFGHGLIDSEVSSIIQNEANFLAVNCQTNSSNYGMNLITKFKRADVFTLDQKELRLAFSDNISSEISLLEKLCRHFNSIGGWLTQGAFGATGMENSSFNITKFPAFTLKVKDTIGAGDAFFAIASICAEKKIPWDVATFLANISGALAANIIGNKSSINKIDVLKYANTLLNF